jgi:hypothetical protein
MNQHQIARLVRKSDESLNPITGNLEVGKSAMIIRAGSNSFIVNENEDIYDLIDDPFSRLALHAYGSAVFVAWGGALDPENGEGHPVRVMVGVSTEGHVSALMRLLDTGEVAHDESGEGGLGGELHERLLALVGG